MKVVVCAKQVLELSDYVEFTPDGRDVDAAFGSLGLNEPDSYAVEEALRLREAADGGEVVVVTVGTDSAEDVLRQCLAMGADRAVRVTADAISLHDPLQVARALAAAVRAEAADVVLCGVQSTDAGQQSTGPALAAVLDVPCVSVATDVELVADGRAVRVHREFEGGLTEVVEVDLPVVLTVQTGLNTPRYGTFKEKMRAKKAEIPVIEPGDVGPPSAVVRAMVAAPGAGGDVEMITGGPEQIAQRIAELVREAAQ